MLRLCDEIQNKRKALYQECSQRVSNIADWYKSVHETFSTKLKNEMREDSPEKYQVAYEILAKEKLLNIIEPLIKLALAKFSYGPSESFFSENGFVVPPDNILNKISARSWLDVQLKFAELAELLAHVLETSQMPYAFDLKVLASDRDQRNKTDHQGTRVQCMTLVRKYESLRGMLAFLDPDNDHLPHFEEDNCFDYDRFVSAPCSFSFKETATVLIADSVHDIPNGYRSVVANLPWDLVIDFDGCSSFGGLLSSVAHNSIRKEWLLADKPFNISSLDRLQTLWCRCGEYLLPDYHSSDSIDVVGAQRFAEETKYFFKAITRALKKALSSVLNMQRFVNIVVLSDDSRIAKSVIDALRDFEFEDYYVSWAGVAKSSIEEDFDDNEGEEFRQKHFYHYECPISSFFKKFHAYADNWEPRSSIKIDYALPTGSGSFVPLAENTRNNLSPYFEVLYRDWDSVAHPDDAFADPFQKGGRATWKDIATGEALPLDEEKEKQLIAQIKSNTGRAQEDSPQKNLFFVVHKAGIGGTTFVKQVAWKLHNDMAVLEVKRYDDTKTFQELQNLYDNIVEKNPILLVAEDTLPNLEAMCDAFLVAMKSRRCALLIACRENSGLYSKYKTPNIKAFPQLKTETIDTLKNKFMAISTLSQAELFEKARNFDTEVVGDIRTPFIIGLYFLEKDFHIESYVRKVLDNSLLPMQKDMIALLALCDMYDSKYLPSLFVNKALGYNLRERHSLIQSCPGAESLICRSITDGIEVYCFKHKLLSEQYFKMYTENQDSGSSRFELAKKLIELAAKCQGASEQEHVIDTLLNILIRNKDRDINDMSQLLVDIALPSAQRSLVQHLAEQFQPSADKLRNEMDSAIFEQNGENATSVLRLVSHAYAHLGKLYAKPPENYEKAAQYLELAEHYMPYDDPFIYHMHGNVLYHQLRKEWGEASENCNPDSGISRPDYEEKVDQAFGLFEKTSEFGDVQFGITGQLNLLFEYLRFIYRVNGIRTKEDLRKLTPKQISYQTRFIDVLDTAKQYDGFDEDAAYNIRNKENQLQSEVLMGDYGKTVEYYQNEYDKLKNSNDTDRALSALQGLVSARIQKAKGSYAAADTKRESFYQMIPDPKTLFDQIETLLPTLYNKRGYYAYAKRTSLFRHWFQLAKLLDCPVNEAMIKANYWVESENDVKGKKNPEPYYYKAMLLCLERLEGGECEGELQAVHNTIARMDSMQQFDPKRGRLDKIKDLLVEGTGMGRLLNVSDCGPAAELANRISEAKKTPTVLSGNVESVQYWGAELSVSAPPALMKQKVVSEIGRMSKNTLSEGQINHKVKFFAGFTAIGIKTVSDSVKDQDTGEAFDVAAILSEMSGGKDAITAKLQGKRSDPVKVKQETPLISQTNPPENPVAYRDDHRSGEHKVFYPKRIMTRKNAPDEPLYLNGEVDDGIGGVSVQYLTAIFGESKIEAYGGIRCILDTLINKVGRMDMVVKSMQEYNGEKRYTLCLRDENIGLSQLLQLQKESKVPTEVKTVREETAPLPDYNGRQVTFIPSDPTLSKTNGRFLVDGVEYAGTLVNVKTGNDRKKAQKYKGKIPAVIQGKPQSGKYSLRMK